MKIKKMNNKGITLIALIVTIIVLIILATVSINLLMGERGIITTASSTKEKQKVAEILEELEVKKADIVIDTKDRDISVDEYIEAVVSDENMIHKINSEEIDRVDEEKSYITVDDEYVFLLEYIDEGNLKITYEGVESSLKPRIQNVQIKSSTNSIEVKVTANRAEKYVFYIKEKDAQNYSDGIEKIQESINLKV